MSIAWASHGPPINVSVGDSGNTILHSVLGFTPGSILGGGGSIVDQGPAGGVTVAAGRSAGTSTAPAGGGYAAQVPSMGTNGPIICLTMQNPHYSTPAQAGAVTNHYRKVTLSLISMYPMCPGGPTRASHASGRAVVPPSPAVVAATYWQSQGVNVLPVPLPRIAPGYALAGNPGYLETGAVLSRKFSDATPLGTLNISATGRLYVDWGDGTGWTGPYDSPGGPWPTGQITHVWDNVGHYDVVVQEHWSATWSLAGTGGSLTTLHTQATIPAFDVRQLESVRNR